MGNGPTIEWKDVISITATVVKEERGKQTKKVTNSDESKRRRPRTVSTSAILVTVELHHKQEEVSTSIFHFNH